MLDRVSLKVPTAVDRYEMCHHFQQLALKAMYTITLVSLLQMSHDGEAAHAQMKPVLESMSASPDLISYEKDKHHSVMRSIRLKL